MTDSKLITNFGYLILNTWCPSSFHNEPYVIVSFSNLTYITSLNIKTKSANINYDLEYTRSNLIHQHTIWHSYRLLNTKQERVEFDPPIIAKYIRLTIKNINQRLCFQLEFFGCIFTDGVVSYSMFQSDNDLLIDDTYDGQYNVKHRYLYSKLILQLFVSFLVLLNKKFIFDTDGLGQLSDGQTGPDNPEDINGFRWVKSQLQLLSEYFCVFLKRLVGESHILKNIIIQLKYYLNLTH